MKTCYRLFIIFKLMYLYREIFYLILSTTLIIYQIYIFLLSHSFNPTLIVSIHSNSILSYYVTILIVYLIRLDPSLGTAHFSAKLTQYSATLIIAIPELYIVSLSAVDSPRRTWSRFCAQQIARQSARRARGTRPVMQRSIHGVIILRQLEASDVKRLKTLERVNTRLKKNLAERDLGIEILNVINAKNG